MLSKRRFFHPRVAASLMHGASIRAERLAKRPRRAPLRRQNRPWGGRGRVARPFGFALTDTLLEAGESPQTNRCCAPTTKLNPACRPFGNGRKYFGVLCNKGESDSRRSHRSHGSLFHEV